MIVVARPRHAATAICIASNKTSIMHAIDPHNVTDGLKHPLIDPKCLCADEAMPHLIDDYFNARAAEIKRRAELIDEFFDLAPQFQEMGADIAANEKHIINTLLHHPDCAELNVSAALASILNNNDGNQVVVIQEPE